MPIRVCHITTVHPRYDGRIFLKECTSLASIYEVHLIVADGKGDETVDGIRIHDIGKPQNRKDRMLHFSKRAYKKAIELNATLYHFHDPELLTTGVQLRKQGKIVIYDSHEDLPRQILTKPWIPKFLRGTVSRCAEWVENRRVRRLSAVVTATPHIADRFRDQTSKSVSCVCNYPILNEITAVSEWNAKSRSVCYVGGIFKERGLFEMLRAIGQTDVRLALAGNFSPASLQDAAQQMQEWGKVDYYGFVGRREINALLGASVAGLLLLHPMPSYRDSLPIKMFEYMAAGIPVICSDFPLWRSIVEDCGCGFCLNPFDNEDVAQKIQYLADHPDQAREMGENGQKAVQEKYNWDTQAEILLCLYSSLLQK